MQTNELDKELRKCSAFISLAICLILAHLAASFTLPELPQKRDNQPATTAVSMVSVPVSHRTANPLVS